MDATNPLGESMTATLGRDITSRDIGFVWHAVDLYRQFLENILQDVERDMRGLATVRLLDFDVVYPSLWRAIPWETSETARLFGVPQSTYHFFRHNKRPFSLPIGTEIEMAAWTVVLAKQERVSCQQLEKQLNALAPALGPGLDQSRRDFKVDRTQRRSNFKEFMQNLDTCITGVVQAKCDLAQLVAIRESEHNMSAGKLQSGVEIDQERYYNMLDTLRAYMESVRPGRWRANWADAYNLAYYAAIRRRHSGGVYPVMVSGTRAVRDAPLAQYLNLPPQPRDPPVTWSRYLTFATAFEQYCGDNRARKRTEATAALESLEPVLDAQREFNRHAMWGWDTSKPEEVPWREFAADKDFKKWAWAYCNWRSTHLAEVLALFEHYGTSDHQLRNTYLQLKTDLLREALEERSSFDAKVRAEDWVSEVICNVRWVSQGIGLRLLPKPRDLPYAIRETEWKDLFDVEDRSTRSVSEIAVCQRRINNLQTVKSL
jgi:hypothetical protein